MGADLAYMGTRFIPVRESLASEDYRSALFRGHREGRGGAGGGAGAARWIGGGGDGGVRGSGGEAGRLGPQEQGYIRVHGGRLLRRWPSTAKTTFAAATAC